MISTISKQKLVSSIANLMKNHPCIVIECFPVLLTPTVVHYFFNEMVIWDYFHINRTQFVLICTFTLKWVNILRHISLLYVLSTHLRRRQQQPRQRQRPSLMWGRRRRWGRARLPLWLSRGRRQARGPSAPGGPAGAVGCAGPGVALRGRGSPWTRRRPGCLRCNLHLLPRIVGDVAELCWGSAFPTFVPALFRRCSPEK